MNRLCVLLVLFTVAAWDRLTVRAATNVMYSTSFSAAEGYNYRNELAGQKSWIKSTSSSGGNGILTNFLGSYAAYVGLWPLQPAADFINVWKPVNYTPVMASNPVVTFSTRMAIIDSTTTNRDFFSWSVYNIDEERLLTIDFDNEFLEISYLASGTNSSWVPTGVLFTNDVAYDLKLRMDLAANRWSAWLDDRIIASNVPLAQSYLARSIGDIDAVWYVYERAKPGDNFMVFDDYTVTVETSTAPPPPPARLEGLGRTPNGQFLLRLSGQSGLKYAIEGSTNLVTWTALRTNTVVDGYFDFIDANSPPSRRFYRGRMVP